LIKTVFELV